MIRRCEPRDFDAIHAVINDGAQAYRGVIADDCCSDPYMPHDELRGEIDAGVEFWGVEQEGRLVSVMGLQKVQDVSLIRHAYTRSSERNSGLGSALLEDLRHKTDRALLIGTWKAATWAVGFYERRGFRLVTEEEKRALLRKYWTVPARQIEESVVLADARWFMSRKAA